MGFGAVGDDGGREAEVGGVEGEDALDVGEHEGMGLFVVDGIVFFLGRNGGRCGREGGVGSG